MIAPCPKCNQLPLIELKLDPVRHRIICCGFNGAEYPTMRALIKSWGYYTIWPWTRAARNGATEKRRAP